MHPWPPEPEWTVTVAWSRKRLREYEVGRGLRWECSSGERVVVVRSWWSGETEENRRRAVLDDTHRREGYKKGVRVPWRV